MYENYLFSETKKKRRNSTIFHLKGWGGGGWGCKEKIRNRSKEHSLSFSLRFYKFESNTISDWLNRMV